MRGASPVKTAAIQMVMTINLILAMETLAFLFLLMLWMTQVLSMVSRARDQMAAMAEITEIMPNTWLRGILTNCTFIPKTNHIRQVITLAPTAPKKGP